MATANLEQYISSMMPQFRQQLADLVRIPSISQEEEHGDDLVRVARETARIARQFGFDATVVIPPDYLPMMVGQLEVNPDAPWVLVYNHLDVQPANEPQWTTNPFEPVVTGEKIIGRGATDDKGPMLATLYALHFLRETEQLNVNVQLVYETGEEKGSPHF